MNVYLDSSPENVIPDLALRATTVLPETWNGWARPVATADAFMSFLDAWRANDPNGEWRYAVEVDGNIRLEYDDQSFPLYGVTDEGTALYDLTGRTWVLFDDDSRRRATFAS